jgi:hypothetical protein
MEVSYGLGLAHEAGWARCVLRIDAQGSASIKLANAGHIERLCHIAFPNSDSLVVCGENNAF